ncbi:MAG: hypothetical protein ACTHYM_09240 [Actinomycetaceae bacterium]
MARPVRRECKTRREDVGGLERRQVPLYIVALAGGAKHRLVAAALTRGLTTQRSPAAVVLRAGEAAMVPQKMLTLSLVVASQAAGIGHSAGELALTVPVLVVFAVVMVGVGRGTAVPRVVCPEPRVRPAVRSGSVGRP